MKLLVNSEMSYSLVEFYDSSKLTGKLKAYE